MDKDSSATSTPIIESGPEFSIQQFHDYVISTLDEVTTEFINRFKDVKPPKTLEELRHDQLCLEESRKKIDHDKTN